MVVGLLAAEALGMSLQDAIAGLATTAPPPVAPFDVEVTRDVPYGDDRAEHLLLDAFLQAYVAEGRDPHVPPRSPPTTPSGSAPLPPLADGWKLPAADEDLPIRLRGWPVWETMRWVLVGVAAANAVLVVVLHRHGTKPRKSAASV
ncbi:MAG: hypothetical protein N2037_08030 [Acidimicrobiales bacterium]|nr:hypothetical protein [Acidimicrobiales bacterium]